MYDSQLHNVCAHLRAKFHDRLRSAIVVIITLVLGVTLWLQLGTLTWPPSPSFEFPRLSVQACWAGGQCKNGLEGKPSKNGELELDLEHDGKRAFRAHGCATRTFIEFGAYRGSVREFSIVGLASKALHGFGHPNFSCQWIPARPAPREGENGDIDANISVVLNGTATRDLPGFVFAPTYSAVVVTCSFDSDVGTDSMGGDLVLYAYKEELQNHDQRASSAEEGERIVVMREKPGDYNETKMRPPYPYDFLYCGSPLYGTVNPCRAREWMAYHDAVFGERAHFVFYDAGGIHDAVRRVLEPWIRRGRVSIQDIRSTVFWDGYLYNQFLMNNDCVHRSKFLANWTFFFDLDEYLYVEPPNTLHQLMEERESSVTAAAAAGADASGSSPVTQFTFLQYRMVGDLCHNTPAPAVQFPVTEVRLNASNCTWGRGKMKLTYKLKGLAMGIEKSSWTKNPNYGTLTRGVAHSIVNSQNVSWGRSGTSYSQLWSFGKLTYRDLSSNNHDSKYACNPRRVYANGVHGAERVTPGGRVEKFNKSVVRYYHYSGITTREDAKDSSNSNLCHESSNNRARDQEFNRSNGARVQYDDSMLPVASKLSTFFDREEHHSS